LLSLAFFTANAQKIKIKKDKVLVDKAEWAKFYKDKDNKRIRVFTNPDGDILLHVKAEGYNDPKQITSDNPKGYVGYWSICDPETGTVYFEMQGLQKKVMEVLYQNEVINPDGTLNKENLDKLAAKMGKDFSRIRDELN
jgi:hypothetical protein